MADMMTFPDTWEKFEEQYGITDREQIYTNGARLIPSFRVKQWLDHIADRKTEPQTEMEKSGSRAVQTARCLNCHNAKACKENHWEVCRYEPWKLTAVDDEPQTDCSWQKGE